MAVLGWPGACGRPGRGPSVAPWWRYDARELFGGGKHGPAASAGAGVCSATDVANEALPTVVTNFGWQRSERGTGSGEIIRIEGYILSNTVISVAVNGGQSAFCSATDTTHRRPSPAAIPRPTRPARQQPGPVPVDDHDVVMALAGVDPGPCLLGGSHPGTSPLLGDVVPVGVLAVRSVHRDQVADLNERSTRRGGRGCQKRRTCHACACQKRCTAHATC